MNTHDRILASLALGGPFNDKAHVWRSLATVAAFAGKDNDEVLELIVGDLAEVIVLRPSTKKPGTLMVAIKANIPAEEPGPLVVMGGNAVPPGLTDCPGEVPQAELDMVPLPGAGCGPLPQQMVEDLMGGKENMGAVDEFVEKKAKMVDMDEDGVLEMKPVGANPCAEMPIGPADPEVTTGTDAIEDEFEYELGSVEDEAAEADNDPHLHDHN